MKISTYILLPVLAIAAACGGSGSGDASSAAVKSPGTAEAPALPTNDRIAELLYDNSYSAPAGFYVDERASTDRSYTVHHVLDESSSFELCTDDYAEAMAWEAADNASRSVQGYFVESYDNERYFEFVRELSYKHDVGNIDDITSPGFGRVYKCSNTDRNGVDRTLVSGYAGTLNVRPLQAAAVKDFAEYLWQFTFFPTSRKKVLDSYSSASGDTLAQTLVLAFASSQGAGRCDRIEVAEWTFAANRMTGEIRKSFQTSHFFEARSVNGTAAICE